MIPSKISHQLTTIVFFIEKVLNSKLVITLNTPCHYNYTYCHQIVLIIQVI